MGFFYCVLSLYHCMSMIINFVNVLNRKIFRFIDIASSQPNFYPLLGLRAKKYQFKHNMDKQFKYFGLGIKVGIPTDRQAGRQAGILGWTTLYILTLSWPTFSQFLSFSLVLWLLVASYKLLITSCQLLATSYTKLVTSCQLLNASCQLLIASYQLLVTSCQLLVTSYQLLVTSYQLLVTSYQLLVTSYQLVNIS